VVLSTLPTSPLPEPGPSNPRGAATEQSGDVVGPYTLLEVIGQGGFGTVWLAERTEPMVQRVALKIIKAGMDSEAVLARFDQERQALAVMDHPNVARIYDGGMSPRGRPYFAMEFVRGEPITSYCDHHNLDIPERLGLFVRVCEAVQHAHLKGIIHRDLKPSNILIQESDGTATPKVIDFGVAKAITSGSAERTMFTEAGQLIGTPEYMSPEQAETSSLDVDTRTDVYSLGVVLYELLTGLLPFDSRVLRSKGYAEIQRVLCTTEPPRPSTRLSDIDDELGTAIAQSRQQHRAELTTSLRRELEWIPLKAMRKDRGERYQTPSELAEDVRRYLRNEPIEAAPESAAYRARKFIKRHRGEVFAASVILAALVAGLGGTLWQAREARAQRDEAIAARKRAETITRFVTTTMRSADPTEQGSQSTTILEAMDTAVRDIRDGRFKDDPETEAALKATIGEILLANGRATEARTLFAEALDARVALFNGDHLDVASNLQGLGFALHVMGLADEAEEYLERALAMRRRLHPADHAEVADSLYHVAWARSTLGRDEEAVGLYTQALEMNRRLGADDVAIARNLAGLAVATQGAGRVAEAEPLNVQVVEMFRRLHPGDHPAVASSVNNLGFTKRLLGRTEEAEGLFREAMEMRRRLYKGDHPDIVGSMKNLADLLNDTNRDADSEKLFEEALAMSRRMNEGDHPDIASMLNSLASTQQSLGRLEQAEQNYTQALAMMKRLYAGDHPSVAACLSNVGFIRNAMGRPDLAEPMYLEAVEMHKRVYPGDHRQTVAAMIGCAFVRQALGRYDLAGAMYREAIEMNKRLFAGDHPMTLNAMNNLCGMLIEQGDLAAAEPVATEALGQSRRLFKQGGPEVANCLMNLARIEQAQKRSVEARAHYDEALAIRRAAAPNGSANLARLLWRSGMARMESQDHAKALAELEEALAMGSRFLAAGHAHLQEYRDAVNACRAAMKPE
jgi:serine/threonine protein kinase/Tfp pilus assembly protein PilF